MPIIQNIDPLIRCLARIDGDRHDTRFGRREQDQHRLGTVERQEPYPLSNLHPTTHDSVGEAIYCRSRLRVGQTLALLDSELGVRLLTGPVVKEMVDSRD